MIWPQDKRMYDGIKKNEEDTGEINVDYLISA